MIFVYYIIRLHNNVSDNFLTTFQRFSKSCTKATLVVVFDH